MANAEVGRAELRGIEGAAALAGWTLETIDPAQTGPDLTPFAPLLGRADGVIAREPTNLGAVCGIVRPETPVVGLDATHARAQREKTRTSRHTVWFRRLWGRHASWIIPSNSAMKTRQTPLRKPVKLHRENPSNSTLG